MANTEIALAYIRVSTNDQDLGMEAQKEAIRRWATRGNITIAGWYEDRGVSGGTPVEDRPGLTQALASLRDCGATAIIVHRRDRLARDVFIAAVVERLAEKNGARILVAEGGGNGQTPEAALMRSIIDAIAQYERAVIRGRIRSALAVKRRRSERVGSIPYGYRLASDGVHLEADAVEAEIVEVVRRMRTEGATYRSIEQHLGELDHRPRSGGRWHATTLKRIAEYPHIEPAGVAH